ncbi:MAG: OmpH family outer membrane protein [Bacteroidales bacterium]|nr:OmpH family outer membrane protein [Bacteroidales bacterium]
MFKRFMLLAITATMMCFAAQAQKFGYVNTTDIFNVMPEKATAENTLKSVSDKYEAEYKNLQDAFQKKISDYEAADKDATTPQAIKDRHNQELQDDYVKIQNFQQTAAQDLQRQQETLLAPITQKLQNAIQAVGAEGGYTFIFDMSSMSILYTGTGAEDITAKVKAKLGIK